MRKFLRVILVLILAGPLSSCSNIFDELASKDTDAAILYSARMFLGRGEWDSAIAEFALLSSAAQSEPDTIVEWASAYSGRCGLDFISMSQEVQNLSGEGLFLMLMKLVQADAATYYQDCVTAETMLKTISTSGVVDTQEGKFLMAFNSLTKIAAILNFRADSDKDDTVDAGWNPCDANGTTDLTNAQLNEIGTGLALFVTNISGLAVGDDFGSDITAICGTLGAGDFCSIYDTASITATHRNALRSLLTETTSDAGGTTATTLGMALNPLDAATIFVGLSCDDG